MSPETIMDTCRLTLLSHSTITPGCSPETYNSGNHTLEEAVDLQGLDGIPLARPPQDLYAFSHYANLAAESQQIPQQNCHVVTIPHWLAQEVLLLHSQWLRNGVVKPQSLQDLLEDFEAAPGVRKILDTAFSTTELWFARLADISPKDSPTEMPIRSTLQLLTILCTSSRARWEMDNHIRSGEHIYLYLRPWDVEMSTGVEFRVFVPPARGHDFRISAISQYSWYKPLPADLEVRQTVERALSGAHAMLDDIVEAAGRAGKADELRAWGFSFDVVVKADGRVQLVEVNPFGVMSETGSCLFHWIKDAKQLYGCGAHAGVEARVLI